MNWLCYAKRPQNENTGLIQYYCILLNAYLCTSLSAQSWQYRDRRQLEVGTIPLSNDFKGYLLCTMTLRIKLNCIPMIF